MIFDDYVRYDAIGLAEQIAQGVTTPLDLLETAEARAKAVNPTLNAIVRDLGPAARERLQRPLSGPLAGVPFLVKDLFQDIAGVPTSCGSRSLAAAAAHETSDVVRRWESAGLVIFGKTNTPEFGAKNITEPELFGPARNPWDPARTPGGSSGGSAAAIAAGVVPVAGGNDGGGSIRIPAAACGLFGLKPGRGLVSIGPTVGEGFNGAAVQGVISRSVRDSALLLDLMQGPEPHAPYPMASPTRPYLQQLAEPVRRLRIGWSVASPIGTPVSPEAAAAVADAVRLLQSLGHELDEAAPPVDGMALALDFTTMWFAHMAALVKITQNQTGCGRGGHEFDTRMMAAFGGATSAVELVECELRLQHYVRALCGFHARYDLWLSPTLAAPPIRIGEHRTPAMLRIAGSLVQTLGLAGLLRRTSLVEDTIGKNLGWTPYTQLANVTGRPAMSVPLYWTPAGLPLGVQFVGPLGGEGLLLQLAAQLEAARPWFDRRPAELAASA